MTSTLTTPHDIFRLGTAFCESAAVLAAVRIGLFTALEPGAASADELADRLGLHRRGVRDFLDLLVTVGALDRDAGGYRNTPVTQRFFVRGADTYAGGFLEGAGATLYPAWGGLTTALRTGQPQAGGDFAAMLAVPAARRAYVSMMDGLSAPLAPVIAGAVDWSGATVLADVGGNRGNLLALLLADRPGVSGVVFDLPHHEQDFDEHMAALGMTGRTRYQPGDFFTDPLPEADILILGHVLADWTVEQRRALIHSAADSIRAGGYLVIYDPVWDARQPDPEMLVASLHMLLMTPGGGGYSTSDCESWLHEAGLKLDRIVPAGIRDTVVIGHRHR